ncbi:MAG: 50S ribosomal protein L13 [Acidobacteria bacterium 37-71-11]|nr:MAG: 50S ribosomal protein L13 [Acidobacteria bacterium 37-71-11]
MTFRSQLLTGADALDRSGACGVRSPSPCESGYASPGFRVGEWRATGDFVIVVNADKVKLTGNKWEDKRYYRHSGDPGHLHQETARELRDKSPERLVRFAVWGMLPKNRLGRALLKKLKVYAGAEHPHQAQQPQAIKAQG